MRPTLTTRITIAIFAGMFCGAIDAAAPNTEEAPPAQKELHIVRASAPPIIDGKLDEAVWNTAATIEDLRQIRPGDGAPISDRTIVYVLYDKDALYVAARMWDRDGPQAISRNIMKQGAGLAEDDRLAIIVDPFNTGRQGYRFEVNVNGVRHESLYQNNQMQIEWTVIWEAAGALTEDGWTAEMAIPFKTLPFDPTIDAWGFNVSRAIRRRGEEALWVSRNRTWNPNILGVARGLTDLDQGVGLDVVPGFTSRHRRSYVNGSSDWENDPSLDVYYRVTPSLTGSLTFNTDFSATEVDERQVNLTRFNLFFPEKRDFFLNDADLFDFGRIGTGGYLTNVRSVTRAGQENGRPFFSRRIGLSSTGDPVDIEYGGKLSGRIGRFNIGTLAVRQDEYQVGTQTVEPTTAVVSRMSANVLAESSLGFIATSGNPLDNRDNSLIGADFLFLNSRLFGDRTLEAEGWYQQTDTDGLEGDDAAFGVGVRLPNATGWRGGAGWRQIEKNFFPALGFVNRVDVRNAWTDVGYTHFVGGARLQSVFAGVDAQQVTSITTGDVQSQIVAIRPLEIESRGRDILRLVYSLNEERVSAPFAIYRSGSSSVIVPPGHYEFDDYGFDIATGTQRRFAGKLTYRTGDFYSGDRTNVGGELTWRQSRFFTARLGYDWNRVKLPQGDFTTRVMRVTSEINFSSSWNWISLFQYDDVSEIFGIHSRLVWIPKAGNEFFLVLNRNFEDLDKDDSFKSITSELNAKASYTFRF
jgi:hypothetical protein